MSRMVVIDSNVFVSMFSEKDPNFGKAQRILEQILRKSVKTEAPSVFLPEVCGAIRRVSNKEFAVAVRNEIESWIDAKLISVYEVTRERMRLASDFAIDLSLKGGDAVFVSLADELNAELLTFDGEVNKRIKNNIKVFRF